MMSVTHRLFPPAGRIACVAALAISLAAGALAQQQDSKSSGGFEPGFTSVAEFGGSASSGQHVLKLDTSAGYNFSRHVAVSAGVPFYFVGGSTTSATGTSSSYSASGIGAPRLALQLAFPRPAFSYASGITVFLPAGNTDYGMSTGRTSFDWNNRIERAFHRVTPFGELGMGNTVVDTTNFNRPYSSHGYNAHFQGGVNVAVAEKILWGASAYDIAPWGTQTIYSRTKSHSTNAQGSGAAQNRFFDSAGVTTGSADIGKDNGFSTWFDFALAPPVEAEIGFTRSVHFALNTVSFNLRFDLARMARSGSQQ